VELQLSIELLKLSKSGHFYFGETGHFEWVLTTKFRITAIMLNKHNSIQAIDRTID